MRSSTESRRRPLLVTGANRSGTTWVGRMLCHTGELVYVHEPFNHRIWPRWFADPLPYRNLYICRDNEDPYIEPVTEILARRPPVGRALHEVRGPVDAAKLVRHIAARMAARVRRGATLLKDPIALFSAPWLAERYDLDVVVMIRGPLAYAGSIVRLGWAFDFRNWLDQPLLLRDLLSPYEADVRAMVERRGDLVDQAILLWNGQYHAVDCMRATHPDWVFVIYEDLARNPTAGFQSLYDRFGLRFDPGVARRVERFSGEQNVKDVAAGDERTIRRDSRAAIETWKHRLTPEQVGRVRNGTAEVAARLAQGQAWVPDG